MPLDTPREDDFDDSLPDISDYQVAHVVNDHNNNDSDFGFSSDDEEEDNHIGEARQGANAQRYANYELIGQDNEPNGNGHPGDSDNEGGGEEDGENGAPNRFYQHNFVVQWVDTDEPLFDRELFEARQARQGRANHNNQNADFTSQVDNTVGAVQVTEEDTNRPAETQTTSQSTEEQPSPDNNQPNEVKLDTEKIDIIKGLMSGFKLPDESFPRWAKEIPEEQWANFLTAKFNDKTS